MLTHKQISCFHASIENNNLLVLEVVSKSGSAVKSMLLSYSNYWWHRYGAVESSSLPKIHLERLSNDSCGTIKSIADKKLGR